MVKQREELLASINTLIGDRNDDESLAIIEDFTDTFNDLETRASDETDWKQKYEENDAEWRKKYRERFTTPTPKDDDIDDIDDEDDEPSSPKTFDELFKTED